MYNSDLIERQEVIIYNLISCIEQLLEGDEDALMETLEYEADLRDEEIDAYWNDKN